jgi:hypothetical protein
VIVIPPGRGRRGDWQWWVAAAAVIFVVSVLAIIVGFVLLAV